MPPRSLARPLALLLAALLALLPAAARAQFVAGVRLGATSLGELVAKRGAAPDSGVTEDGSYIWLSYPPYTFYFSPDSVAQAVRFLPSGLLRREVEKAFGKPISEVRSATLNLDVRYSDTASVQYDASGDTALFITYRRRGAWAGLGTDSPRSVEAFKYFESRLLFLLSAACLNQPLDVPGALGMLNRHATSYGDSVAILSLRVDLRTSRSSVCETVKAKLVSLK